MCGVRGCIAFAVALCAFFAHCIVFSFADEPLYFVANTKPPDAYLALRSEPSGRQGLRLMEMPNGTLLRVLERRSDGWWRVRVFPSNQEGWALSGQSGKNWIACCDASVAEKARPESGPTTTGSVVRPGSAVADKVEINRPASASQPETRYAADGAMRDFG